MTISVSTDQVDENRREKLTYGTSDFPIAFFDDDLTKVSVPWHWHEEFEIVKLIRGSVVTWVGGEEITLNAGEGYFANSGVLHAAELRSETGWQHAMVFDSRLLGCEDDIFRKKYILPIIDRGDMPFIRLAPSVPWQQEVLSLAEAAWNAGAYEMDDYPITVRENLCRIFSLLLKHADDERSENLFTTRNQREEFRVKKAIAFIEKNYAEPLSIGDIAASADISISACLRCFHSVLHTTPIRYLRQYRLKQAAAMLSKQDERTVVSVASSCGFMDQSYFDRCFRAEFGVSPSEFRSGNSI